MEKSYQEKQQKIVQAEGEAEAAKMISFSKDFKSQADSPMMRLGKNELSES